MYYYFESNFGFVRIVKFEKLCQIYSSNGTWIKLRQRMMSDTENIVLGVRGVPVISKIEKKTLLYLEYLKSMLFDPPLHFLDKNVVKITSALNILWTN